jgi:hypothetical protein
MEIAKRVISVTLFMIGISVGKYFLKENVLEKIVGLIIDLTIMVIKIDPETKIRKDIDAPRILKHLNLRINHLI